MRKQRKAYPPPKTATKRGRSDGGDTRVRTTVVVIDLNAGAGQANLSIGNRVRIVGGGLYSNETATIESFAGGPVPTARVRTDAGRTRQVRTIDLEVTRGEST